MKREREKPKPVEKEEKLDGSRWGHAFVRLNASVVSAEAAKRLETDATLRLGLNCCAVCARVDRCPQQQREDGEEGASGAGVSCSTCGRVRYCSKKHLLLDRATHLQVCEALVQCT